MEKLGDLFQNSGLKDLGFKFEAGTKLGTILSGLLNIVFYVAVFFTFYMLVWGALQYIMSQGQKENLAKARSRITWALIGLVVVLLAYFIATYAGEILKPSRGIPF